jgi:hypothetical protein
LFRYGRSTFFVADSSETTGLKWQAASSGNTIAGAFVYNSTGQSINNTTNTAMNMDTEVFDTDGFHDTSTNNSRITVPAGKAGYYHIVGTYSPLDNANGVRSANIYKNGSLYFQNSGPGWATYGGSVQVTGVIYLAETDYVQLFAWQSSGGALSTNANNTFYTSLMAVRIGG